MNQIGPYGKIPGSNPANRDDFLDNGDANSSRNKQEDGTLAGFDNSGLQDENADPRAGGKPQQRHSDDLSYQAELAAKTSSFQRSLSAAQHQDIDAEGMDIADDDSGDDHFDSFSGLMGSGSNRSGHHTTGQQGLSQLFAHNNTAGTQIETEGTDEKLLAESLAMSSTIPVFTTLQQTGGVQAPASISRAHDIVSGVENRVTQAIQAELAASSGSINNISINVAGLIEGLTAITIRMSATGMEIVLSGVVDELAGEAQALADRLSKRFSNRNVRILSGPSTGDGTNDDEDTLSPPRTALNAPIKGPDSIT